MPPSEGLTPRPVKVPSEASSVDRLVKVLRDAAGGSLRNAFAEFRHAGLNGYSHSALAGVPRPISYGSLEVNTT